MLLIDTNVLARCSQGHAMGRIESLLKSKANLATTDRNASELNKILVTVFGMSEAMAVAECARVMAALHMIPSDLYDDLRLTAARRLSVGGQSDWPLLAAALALRAEIWSDDRDFFGVGVAVWHSDNVMDYIGPDT